MSIAAPAVEHALAALPADYEIIECDPALADTAVFCERYGYSLANSANAIIVTSKSGEKQFVVCVVLADTRIDVNKVVRKRLGVRRISFASAEETRDLTGMELGGVTPFGLPDGLAVWVDQRVMDRDYVILGGGNRSSKIKISPDVFRHMRNVSVVQNLAFDPEPRNPITDKGQPT